MGPDVDILAYGKNCWRVDSTVVFFSPAGKFLTAVSGWSKILLLLTGEVTTEGVRPKEICLVVFSLVGTGAGLEASAGHTWLEFSSADNSTVGSSGPGNISSAGSLHVLA